jgi:3',5'-cyclic AMP phosphodiesterase CpdA
MTVRIFHVSDLHFGREDRAALDWFAGDVARERPDAVVCTGDLTWRGTASEFAAAQEWLSALGVPVSIEPGNHDMPYYWNPLRRLTRPYDRFRALRREVHSELALAHVRVVPLKTVARIQMRLNQSKGRVSSRALAETLEHLHAAADTPLRLVACHHPLVDAGTHSTGSTRGGHQALAALAHAGADAVLSGHVHDPFDLNVEAGGHRIRLIGAGTLSERLRKSPPGYNLLEWSPDAGLEVTVRHRG